MEVRMDLIDYNEWKYDWNLGEIEESYDLADNLYEIINNRAVDLAY